MARDNIITRKELEKLLKDMEKRLVAQIVESNKDIIATSEKHHNEVLERLDQVELDTPTRREFEALKRKVERLSAH